MSTVNVQVHLEGYERLDAKHMPLGTFQHQPEAYDIIHVGGATIYGPREATIKLAQVLNALLEGE